ncbi:hypothetical protein [Actinoplanes sp. M2I2]|uniref:hypothetical protein n=1 Tax=Actinoplanes sp. M2I2 TaxID=1734444 RepID=UPI002021B93C|nr:hypothetical protein [Actinoplanes sp. M2I2]
MTSTVATLPDFHTAPPDATPSVVTATIRGSRVSRRTVLQLVGGGALGLGLAALDLVTRALPSRATNPNPVLSVWNDCRGYYSSSPTTCVPATAWYSSTCNGSWHRNDSYSGSSVTYNYTFDNTSCSSRNAWRWTGSGVNRKCSDGRTVYRDGSTSRNTFSICRTAI